MGARMLFAIAVVSSLLLCCKKNGPKAGSTSANQTTTSDSTSNIITVFTNISDPRLAQIQTTTGFRYTFFGQRNAIGQPITVTAYSLAKLPDSVDMDYVMFDDSGRYSNILLHTGAQMHVNYGVSDSLQITVALPDSTPKVYTTSLSSQGAVRGSHPSIMAPSGHQPALVTGGSGGPIVLGGSDGNVDISVTYVNTYDNGTAVDAGATVMVNITDGSRLNISLPAVYNPQTQFYSVPLTKFSSDFAYNPTGTSASSKTLQLIAAALNLVCLEGPDNDPSLSAANEELASSVLADLELYACATGPATCAAVNALLITCKATALIDLINNVINNVGSFIETIDPNAAPYSLNAAVSVTAYDSKYNMNLSSPSQTVNQILSNFGGNSDFQLAFNYVDSTSCAFTFVIPGMKFINEWGQNTVGGPVKNWTPIYTFDSACYQNENYYGVYEGVGSNLSGYSFTLGSGLSISIEYFGSYLQFCSASSPVVNFDTAQVFSCP
jgi:hypothetical protein